jgi:hypothetical protein
MRSRSGQGGMARRAFAFRTPSAAFRVVMAMISPWKWLFASLAGVLGCKRCRGHANGDAPRPQASRFMAPYLGLDERERRAPNTAWRRSRYREGTRQEWRFYRLIQRRVPQPNLEAWRWLVTEP